MIFVCGITEPPHNLGTEAGARNFELTMRLFDPDVLPYCEHCEERRLPTHMPGDGWAMSHIHQPHCPEHEDNHAATEVQLVGLADDVLRDHAEAIWAATHDDHEH